uniref:VWFA domain-containing protein n=1 Tax=Clytia hemisphaerica TaxID=252671 RepID=A0A7M5XDD3_9CNID
MMKMIRFFLLLVSFRTVQGCQYTEVSLVLDVSGSIYPKAFDQTKEFIRQVLSGINIAEDSKASVVTFTEQAIPRIYCDEYNSSATLEQAILNLKYIHDNHLTNIRDGLIKGRETLSMRGCGRAETKQIMILITDGNANRGNGGFEGIQKESEKLRTEGITIIALGVGQNIQLDVLRNITANKSLLLTSRNLDKEAFTKMIDMLSNQQRCLDGKIETDQRTPCLCKTPNKWREKKWKELDEISIAKDYSGVCYLEKLEKAWNELRQHKKVYQSLKLTNARCIERLRTMIPNIKEQFLIQKLFNVYDECIREDCFLEDTVSRTLEQQETFLLGESTSCANWMNKD